MSFNPFNIVWADLRMAMRIRVKVWGHKYGSGSCPELSYNEPKPACDELAIIEILKVFVHNQCFV
jgi:hypothetical protein